MSIVGGSVDAFSLKVVLVTGSLGEAAGGLSSAVRAWAEALAETVAQVTVFYLDHEAAFGPARQPRHPRVTAVAVPCWVEPRTRLILAPRLARRLMHHCRTHGADVIHANGVWLPGTRIAVRLARRLGLPCVVSPHGHLQPWAMQHRPLKKRLAWAAYGRRSLAHASLIQAASAAERESVRALGVATPVAMVPNMVAVPRIWPEPRATGDTRRTVLFLSRVHPSKGVMDLVSAWDRLRPPGWRVVVAGPDEVGHLAALRHAVAQRNLQDDFEFAGPVPYESRWAWYRAADVFVLPSYSENFGVSVAEALAAGVPVITTRAAPWAELVDQGCGWWIETGPDALAAALRAATAMDDGQRRAMGARGRTLMMQRYSVESVTIELLAAYERARAACPSP